MKQRATPEELIRRKLSETAVPDYREGWVAMRGMLEQRQPQPRAALLPWRRMAAAAVLLAALGGWWMLRPSGQDGPPVVVVPEGTAPATAPARTPIRPIVAAPSTHPLPAAVLAPFSDPTPSRHPWPPLPVLTAQGLQLQETPALPAPALSGPAPAAAPAGAVRRPAPPLLAGAEASTLPPAAEKAEGWQLALHLNANGASSFGHAETNDNPLLKGSSVDLYPSLLVRKGLSRRLSLQAGLALASPVDLPRRDFSFSVPNPTRAMAADVQASADQITLQRLYYADIPLTLHYHLSERLSVGSGLQLSLLQKVIGEKQRADYDAMNFLAYVDPVEPEPRNLRDDKEAGGSVRSMDMRWVAGLRYRFAPHWEASLQYQQGLADISGNQALTGGHAVRNAVVHLGLGFVIR